MVTLMCNDFHISNFKSRFFKIQVTFDVYFFTMGFWFQVGESRFLQKEKIFFYDLLKHMLIFIS